MGGRKETEDGGKQNKYNDLIYKKEKVKSTTPNGEREGERATEKETI